MDYPVALSSSVMGRDWMIISQQLCTSFSAKKLVLVKPHQFQTPVCVRVCKRAVLILIGPLCLDHTARLASSM